MIITTNFDRLMERALEKEGVEFVAINSEDSLKGAVPYVFSKCTLVKINGDYRDIRTRNTAEELSNYGQVIMPYLERILNDFGLIVCGWSADWDTALRTAIAEARDVKYSSFWLTKGPPSEKANELIQTRGFSVTNIESADEFFTKLGDRVEAIKRMSQGNTLSVSTSASLAKKYLSDERYAIELHDLVHHELREVRESFSQERFSLMFPRDLEPEDYYRKRITDYDKTIEKLLMILTSVAAFGKAKDGNLIRKVLESLPTVRKDRSYNESLQSLCFYPSLVLAISNTIAALWNESYEMLPSILVIPTYYDLNSSKEVRLIEKLRTIGLPNTIEIKKERGRQIRIRMTDHIVETLFERRFILEDDKDRFRVWYQRAEYLYALVYAWLVPSSDEWDLPLGSYVYRWDYRPFAGSQCEKYFSDLIVSENPSPLIGCGLFDGDLDKLQSIKEQVDQIIEKSGPTYL